MPEMRHAPTASPTPIDALAVARAALREPGLPAAQLDGAEREVRLLVDHRENLVAERTRFIGRLRWHLHELDPGWQPPAKVERASAYDKIEARLATLYGTVARLARALVYHARMLTDQIDRLTTEITTLVTQLAPSLMAIPGCGSLRAAKILGETAGAQRFRSKDAYARHTGTAPLPVWSSNRTRHRLSRTGNRQLNATLHRITLTQGGCGLVEAPQQQPGAAEYCGLISRTHVINAVGAEKFIHGQ